MSARAAPWPPGRGADDVRHRPAPRPPRRRGRPPGPHAAAPAGLPHRRPCRRCPRTASRVSPSTPRARWPCRCTPWRTGSSPSWRARCCVDADCRAEITPTVRPARRAITMPAPSLMSKRLDSLPSACTMTPPSVSTPSTSNSSTRMRRARVRRSRRPTRAIRTAPSARGRGCAARRCGRSLARRPSAPT